MIKNMQDLLYKEESHRIIGICMEVYNILGRGLLEAVYKDALEYELKNNRIEYQREKEYPIIYKDMTLKHKFYADFIVYNAIILEVKASSAINKEHIRQTLNYLAISKCKLGLIVNFGEESLKFKRVLL